MSTCAHCGQENDPGSRFCLKCGQPLTPPTTTQPEADPRQLTDTPPVASWPPPPSQPEPATDAWTSPTPPPPPRPQSSASVGQLGSGDRSLANLWGPFAGRGERGNHVAWLMDGHGDSAERLSERVQQRFKERRIPRARVSYGPLTARGVVVENRPYYLVERGMTTVGLHIARFGDDLFTSMVTYARGPIDPLRVAILALMLLFQLFMSAFYGAAVSNAALSMVDSFGLFGGPAPSPAGLGFLLCCVGPLGFVNTILLMLAAGHMFYKFVTIKDPLMLLRRPPNEFETDDTIALERAVEETVRSSLDAIGLDTSLLIEVAETPRSRRIL